MLKKKVLVIGASEKPERYANKAVRKLLAYDYEVSALGARSGKIKETPIHTEKMQINDLYAVSLYLGEKRQQVYYDYIIGLKPKQLVFNPGAENPELAKLAKDADIKVINDCTLVMLNEGSF